MTNANDNDPIANDNDDDPITDVRVIHKDGSETKVALDTIVYVSDLHRDWEEAWTLGEALNRMYDSGCPTETMAWMVSELVKNSEVVNARGRIGLWPHKETRQ